MKEDCICDSSSQYTEEKIDEIEEEKILCNRIFLNFNRELRDSGKDSFKIAKVKDLFKYLSDRQDLQEMKVSGWREQQKKGEEYQEEDDEEEEYEEKDNLSCGRCSDSISESKGGGQRFAMSRDFWYRKLNTLKARKLDEVALEANDIPPDERRTGREGKEEKKLNTLKVEVPTDGNVYSSELPEDKREIRKEICRFERRVAKPVEKVLKERFVNVYDNRKYFMRKCN